MLNNLFSGVFDSTTQSVIFVPMFLLLVGDSLAIGIFLALVYSYKNQCTKSFVTTLALLPSIVCVVNYDGQRQYRSRCSCCRRIQPCSFSFGPRSAKEICSIFMAMGTGLVAGMGYLGFAVVFALILGVAFLICNLTNIGLSKSADRERLLRTTIPEDLDYTNMFHDLLKKIHNKLQDAFCKNHQYGQYVQADLSCHTREIQALKRSLLMR